MRNLDLNQYSIRQASIEQIFIQQANEKETSTAGNSEST